MKKAKIIVIIIIRHQDENVYTSESNQLKNNELESLDDESNKNIDKNPAKKSTNDEEDQNNYDH